MLKKLVSVDNTGIEEFVGQEMKEYAKEVVFYKDYPTDEAVLVQRLKDADGLLVSWNTKIPESVLSQLPQLKYIGLCCSLITKEASNVDIDYAMSKNIAISDVKHYGDEGVVEFIISELIQLLKGLKGQMLYDEQVELSDLSIGIIGLGILGEKVAKACKSFGMTVYYHNRHEKPDSPYTYLTLEEMVEICDVISTHLPRHAKVMTAELFERFNKNKVFINTTLTPTYDLQAFNQWIEKESHYAIMDAVSLTERLKAQYKSIPQIITSDSVTGFTKTARRRLAQAALENLKNFVRK